MSPTLKNTLAANATNRSTAEALARSIYAELRTGGCGTDDVLAICTRMIDEVTSELKASDPALAQSVANAA